MLFRNKILSQMEISNTLELKIMLTGVILILGISVVGHLNNPKSVEGIITMMNGETLKFFS